MTDRFADADCEPIACCAMATWIPVLAALLAAFAALTVPRVTFQLALRRDGVRIS